MKTIKDAVIELDGKLPAADCKYMHQFLSKDVWGCNSLGIEGFCTRSEFEAEAKRLGYINGYRWGVEYPTNGKRPDLPSDVWVSCKIGGEWDCDNDYSDSVVYWNWPNVQAFKVLDPRYKPVSEISESKSDEAVVSEKLESNWHDRGELPPVGVDCLCQAKKDVGRSSFCKVKIVGYGKTTVAMESLQNTINAKAGDLFVESFDDLEFRPIRTHRENVIEAAVMAAGAEPLSTSNYVLLDCLYNAGMLVLPPETSNTK